MTEKVYFYTDSLELESYVTSCVDKEENTHEVILERTLFHPQGGGQPSDVGCIGESKVLSVHFESNKIVHITDRPVSVGKANLKIDSLIRNLHTRYHSAGHLITLVAHKHGLYSLKANHTPSEAKVLLSLPEEASYPTIEELEQGVNQLIASDCVRVQYEENGVRYVSWEGLPLIACDGTHCVRTSNIGRVLITKVRKKNNTLAVSYRLDIE